MFLFRQPDVVVDGDDIVAARVMGLPLAGMRARVWTYELLVTRRASKQDANSPATQEFSSGPEMRSAVHRPLAKLTTYEPHHLACG